MAYQAAHQAALGVWKCQQLHSVTLCGNMSCAGCLWHRYGCYLVFQLRTHHDLFCAEDEDEEPVMTFPGALTVLAAITVAVAVCSE